MSRGKEDGTSSDVPRHHARIQRTGGGWLAEDLGSANGTLLYETKRAGRNRVASGSIESYRAQ